MWYINISKLVKYSFSRNIIFRGNTVVTYVLCNLLHKGPAMYARYRWLGDISRLTGLSTRMRIHKRPQTNVISLQLLLDSVWNTIAVLYG